MMFCHLALAALPLAFSSIGLATASGSPSTPQAEVPRPHAADFERFEQWLGNWEGTCVGHNRDGTTNTYPVKPQVRRTHGGTAIGYQAQYQGEGGIVSWRIIRTFEEGRTRLTAEVAEGSEPFWTRWTFEEATAGDWFRFWDASRNC